MSLLLRHALAIVITAALGSACDNASTLCSTVNSDIVLKARVDDSDTSTRIELAFSEAESSAIPRPFCADDSVTINGQEAALIRRPSGNTIFALNLDEPAETYTIIVNHDGTPTELIAKPEAPVLSLTAPSADSELSRAEPLSVAWEPALGEPEEVTVIVGDKVGGSTCLADLFSADTVDSGAFEVPASSLSVAAGIATKTLCKAFVEVIRLDEVPFTLSRGAAFHPDSRLVAATGRALSFTSAP